MLRRVGTAGVAAAALLAAALSAQAASGTSSAQSASHPFGYGTPQLTASVAPQDLYGAAYSGEPSIGIHWSTGAGFYIAGESVYRLTFDNRDGSVAWSPLDIGPASNNLDPILVTEPRSGVTLAGGDNGGCSELYRSSDDGATWTPSLPCTIAYDHPTVSYAPSAVHPGSLVFYYCQQGPDEAVCATSTNDGVTWNPPVPAEGAGLVGTAQQTCLGAFGHLRGSADGTAYLPAKQCGGPDGAIRTGGMRTTSDGLTWSVYQIPSSVWGGAFDPVVATTPDNTLYEGWQNATDNHPLIAVSRNRGTTWTKPVDLAGSVNPPLVAATLPTLLAGDNGRLAYSFLGTSVGSGNPNVSGFHGVWYLYTSFTYDGGAHWTTVKDTSKPVQYGEVDAGGVATSGQRNLLDFIESALTKDGRVVVAYATGCFADCQAKGAAGDLAGAEALSTHSWASIAYQTSGRGLFAAGDVATPRTKRR